MSKRSDRLGRSIRKQGRELRKDLRDKNYDLTCAICLEDIRGQPLPNAAKTVCGHWYHKECFQKYGLQHGDIMKRHHNGEEISNADFAQLVKNTTVGPPCPCCRKEAPYIHELSGNLQKKGYTKFLASLGVQIDKDFALRCR